MNVRAVVAGIALLVFTVSLIGIVVGAIGLYYAYTQESYVEFVTGLRFIALYSIAALLSLPIILSLRRVQTGIIEGFVIIAVSWLVLPLISAVSYMVTVGFSFVDAYFESISGFTGTGLTVMESPQDMPKTVLLWRAITQWIGELGVVVVSGTFLPLLHRVIKGIYEVERGARIAPTIIATTRRLFTIYVVFTFIGTLVLVAGGMNLFDALTHSMTAIATGGFSTRSESIGYWSWSRVVVVGTMAISIIGAFNFADNDLLIRGRFRELIHSSELRWFLALLTMLVLATGAAYVVYESELEPLNAFYIGVYHAISGMTTTGFQVDDLSHTADQIKALLVLGMVIGGCTFSTAGGLKIKRVAIALKNVAWEAASYFIPPTMMLRRRLGREPVDDAYIRSVYNFIFVYITTLGTISISISVLGYSFIDSLFETASALSCVGLSVGVTSMKAPLAVKLLLITAMYLGRIEFLPLYIAVGRLYARKLRVT
ncbi:MAG: hypothetical protein DRO12_04900 [Thermoprotei archaeon]|nr:MAG: hypothetical protein DRO12_04900 [Thermoprotei archaeon]